MSDIGRTCACCNEDCHTIRKWLEAQLHGFRATMMECAKENGKLRTELAACQSDERDAVSIEEIRGAVARGWCHPKTAHKEMDSDLSEMIAFEIHLLLNADAYLAGKEGGDEQSQS